MSVSLRKRKNTDGTTSLMLDIYHNGGRRYEFLKNLKLEKPTTPLARAQNKERIRQAESIKVARAAELDAMNYNIPSDIGKKTVITVWMDAFIDKYDKKDKRIIRNVKDRFKDFLKDQKKPNLTFGGLTEFIIEDFIGYLEKHCSGEGAKSYYARFKKMIRYAYRREHLMQKNVLDNVERKPKGEAAKKDILTLEEIQALAATPTESSEVRRAALFSLMTGLRWCDVKILQWENIRTHDKKLLLRQSKTDKEVSVPINDTAIQLLGKPGNSNELIFDLPTANGANKTLKAWVKRAGIDKKITWHNLRHSFGTNLIFTDTDVLTASKLLGHTSLRHTQRYVDVAEEMKQKATDKLNVKI